MAAAINWLGWSGNGDVFQSHLMVRHGYLGSCHPHHRTIIAGNDTVSPTASNLPGSLGETNTVANGLDFAGCGGGVFVVDDVAHLHLHPDNRFRRNMG